MKSGNQLILLHTCCGPCATSCIERLQADGYTVTLFYANSNISPEAEFERRLATAQQLATHYATDLVVDPYDHAAWSRAITGYESEPEKGPRCSACFRFNLARAADYAARHAFAGYTTSLTVSPHKISEQIFRATTDGDGFIAYNFKKQAGYKRSQELTEALGLYRQDYCGCEFSRRPPPDNTAP
jgi:predicted adenine nucleotide alpha hydrolase (AANH) superfamily ATPase